MLGDLTTCWACDELQAYRNTLSSTWRGIRGDPEGHPREDDDEHSGHIGVKDVEVRVTYQHEHGTYARELSCRGKRGTVGHRVTGRC